MNNTTTSNINKSEAQNITCKLETLHRNYQSALDNGKAREAYNIIVKTMQLDNELKTIYESSIIADVGQQIATSIAIHSLKVLARGRKYTNKDGETVFTPANIQALKILESGKNDTTGIIEDLIQSVYLAIWEAITADKLTIGKRILDNGKEIDALILTNGDDDQTMRGILNVVQSEFYKHQQRHYKHEYRITIDDEGNESAELVTAAMREYEKRIEYIGQDELFNTLSVKLNDKELVILRSKLETKQVERWIYNRRNGENVKGYVTRYKTLDEISVETGYSKKIIRNVLDDIKVKCNVITTQQNEDILIKELFKNRI